MKFNYNREVDILKIWLSDEPFDYAEESAGVIAHLTEDGKPAAPEIRSARDFVPSSVISPGSVTSMVNDEEVILS